MITRVSLPITPKAISMNSTPSFGLAKLNDLGRSTADSFGYQNNQFIDSRMFKKQNIFQKSMLGEKIAEGRNFTDLCRTYGCTDNSKTNSEFIENQILSSKGKSVLKKVEAEERKQGLLELYNSNYDNPDLSLKQTRALLEKVRESITDEDYVRFIGILDAGTK